MGSGAHFGSMGNVLRQNIAPLLSRQVRMQFPLVLLMVDHATSDCATGGHRRLIGSSNVRVPMQRANAHAPIRLQGAAQHEHEQSACGPRYRCGALMCPAGVHRLLGGAGGGQGAGQPHHRVHADGAHRQPGVQVQVRPAGCMTPSTPAAKWTIFCVLFSLLCAEHYNEPSATAGV
jgi:hypothetical protein